MYSVTLDQIAHKLQPNGKPARKSEKVKIDTTPGEEADFFQSPFSMEELQKAIKEMKPNKAAAVDGIRTEQIQHFGNVTTKWILTFTDNCVLISQIPKL